MDFEGLHVSVLDSQVDFLEPEKTLREQAGTDEQYQSERHLADDERTPEVPRSDARRSASGAVPQETVNTGVREPQCRHQTRQQGGEEGHADGEEQEHAVGSNLRCTWERLWDQCDQCPDTPERQHDTSRTADGAHEEALGQQLPNESPPTGAEC